MYGLAPSDEVDIKRFNLKTVMSLKCCVDHIKIIDAGEVSVMVENLLLKAYAHSFSSGRVCRWLYPYAFQIRRKY